MFLSSHDSCDHQCFFADHQCFFAAMIAVIIDNPLAALIAMIINVSLQLKNADQAAHVIVAYHML